MKTRDDRRRSLAQRFRGIYHGSPHGDGQRVTVSHSGTVDVLRHVAQDHEAAVTGELI
jgi:hypothetical protein